MWPLAVLRKLRGRRDGPKVAPAAPLWLVGGAKDEDTAGFRWVHRVPAEVSDDGCDERRAVS